MKTHRLSHLEIYITEPIQFRNYVIDLKSDQHKLSKAFFICINSGRYHKDDIKTKLFWMGKVFFETRRLEHEMSRQLDGYLPDYFESDRYLRTIKLCEQLLDLGVGYFRSMPHFPLPSVIQNTLDDTSSTIESKIEKFLDDDQYFTELDIGFKQHKNIYPTVTDVLSHIADCEREGDILKVVKYDYGDKDLKKWKDTLMPAAISSVILNHFDDVENIAKSKGIYRYFYRVFNIDEAVNHFLGRNPRSTLNMGQKAKEIFYQYRHIETGDEFKYESIMQNLRRRYKTES